MRLFSWIRKLWIWFNSTILLITKHVIVLIIQALSWGCSTKMLLKIHKVYDKTRSIESLFFIKPWKETPPEMLCIVLYCIYLPSIIEMLLYIYKFVKSHVGKNNNVCDVKYITTCTNLIYHWILDGRNSQKKLLKVLISIRVALEL